MVKRIEQLKFKRYPKEKLVKYYAQQYELPFVDTLTQPHIASKPGQDKKP